MNPPGTAELRLRPCSSCGRPRAECRTPVDLFLSCCHTCAANDGDTHTEGATIMPAQPQTFPGKRGDTPVRRSQMPDDRVSDSTPATAAYGSPGPEHEVVHLCPPDGSGLMPCCGKTPFEVPRYHRMTVDPKLVTCARAI